MTMRPPEHAALGLEDYADAHWRDFLPKQVHAGVRLSPESVGKRFKAKGGWVATCLNRNEDGSYVCVHRGSPGWITHKADGSIATAGFEDFWLISELDEKGNEPCGSAEAGVKANGDCGAQVSKVGEDANEQLAQIDACVAGGTVNSAKPSAKPPAQPAILPTWTDGDIKQFCYTHKNQTVFKHMDDARKYVQSVLMGGPVRKEKAKHDDRRTEHVPVAKTWRGLGIAK